MEKKYYLISYRWIKAYMDKYECSNMVIDIHPIDWLVNNQEHIRRDSSSERGAITFYEEISEELYHYYKEYGI